MPKDLHSHADPARVRVTHSALDWRVDFAAKRLEGQVIHRVERRDPRAPLILDVKALEIDAVASGDASGWHEARWMRRPGEAALGDALEIALDPDDDRVRLRYRTTDEGTGLQWLDPAQTTGGRHPFLFSQSQAIHARTWIPCQDSPGVRASFEARVEVPQGLRAVMSAAESEDGEVRNGRQVFHFRMPHAVPSYLVALAVGELAFESLGPRSGVYAEPGVVSKAASEFRDTESMIDAVEALYGPYRWGRYDLLVLPPSFPFGGMENPCLTFATPTILAGDRSLVALVAHELAHSWSGNLVTNATWRDFWLNEGFTVYLEQRIMEAIFGKERKAMEVMLGMQELREEMAELAPKDQILHVDLEGRDPDEGFTGVPYEKGAAFLRRLEELFGRQAFDDFLRAWFDQHAFSSVTTATFREFLQRELLSRDPRVASAIDVDLWIEAPGLPADAPDAASPAFQKIDAALAAWREKRGGLDQFPVAAWTTHEWLHFIGKLGARLDQDTMAALDQRFSLTRTGNAEILAAWLELAIKSHYEPAFARLREFLVSQGRRKFLKPLYAAMAKDPTLTAMANSIYDEARPGYHAISSGSIDEIMGR
ncbi:MAG: M1 family metallopeptidase [Planctomycetes bacterium]|nr:M1 family metallopeptidase [Planctomycetota bacterium]